MSQYRSVLVGTDGSDSSLVAVERAAELARASAAPLHVACAYRPLTGRALTEAVDRLGPEAHKVAGASPADDTLREAEGHARRAGADAVHTHAVEGDPGDVLAQLALEQEADLVVVGNRGLNSLAGRLLGSVPADVAHRAGCDVLIVHTTSGR
ncbi:MAG: universal stress protein [Actinomycetes bacterium]